ncbi:hypothetical protein CC85DRAFT_285118 [Cutaneotrichosporon oleaginosum]|uniref:Uncharacterized protein n=1 Tax=Cutaneotrichosporon oleaginosum TaxID=879819 RepID=A0A0J1B5K3_9TREE|nr:uncharacterized protein CC85DRAFT_285118 [Cutaneotrichosporon oleaginosum]KLT42959.1 hypothetical protein CC85DRAFT_285118 [Cutaneotrichosporon oleaginosum]TXT12658.1 hypothetical protein COLE_03068 [Cutaneotrichosporon oleaginosum]
MSLARRVQTSVHGALIGLAIPYIWLNITLLASDAPSGRYLPAALMVIAWVLLVAVLVLMSKRDGLDPFQLSLQDGVSLACAFMHGAVCNLELRRGHSRALHTITSLISTVVFGTLCMGAIVIHPMVSRGSEEDAAMGLVMDGGEEGALSLTNSPRIEWPHFYTSSRLKVYRLAAAVCLVSLASVTERAIRRGIGFLPGLMLITFMAVSVALSLIVNGPRDGKSTNPYYRLAKGTLVAANTLLIVFAYTFVFASWAVLLRPWPIVLFCLSSVSLLIAVVRYDQVHPNEDAVRPPSTDVDATTLFDPETEGIES